MPDRILIKRSSQGQCRPLVLRLRWSGRSTPKRTTALEVCEKAFVLPALSSSPEDALVCLCDQVVVLHGHRNRALCLQGRHGLHTNVEDW